MRFRDTLIVSHVAIFEARLYCNLSTTGQCQLPQRYLQQTTGSINHTRIICGPSRTTDCPHELVNSQFISTFDTIDRDRHTHVCETSREEPVRATWPEIPKEPRNNDSEEAETVRWRGRGRTNGWPLTPPGQITRFSRAIFPQHVRQIRKHDVSPVGQGEAGLLPAGNDETDGQQRDEDARGKGVVRVPVPAGRRVRSLEGSLMKCRHYRAQDKTHFCLDVRRVYYPRTHASTNRTTARPNCRSSSAKLNEPNRYQCPRRENIATSLESPSCVSFLFAFLVLSRSFRGKCVWLRRRCDREKGTWWIHAGTEKYLNSRDFWRWLKIWQNLKMCKIM